MNKSLVRSLLLASGLIIGPGLLQSAVWAQPPVAPPANVTPPPENGARGQGGWANMTPEQRQAAQKEMIHRYGAMVLNAAGITDAATQDALLDFYTNEQQQQVEFREKFQRFAGGLVTLPNAGRDQTPLTDEQVEQNLADLQTAVDAEKLRRKNALAALDLKIHYTTNPRLHAVLIAGGLDGDASALAGVGGSGIAAFFASDLANAARAARRADTRNAAGRPAAPGGNTNAAPAATAPRGTVQPAQTTRQ